MKKLSFLTALILLLSVQVRADILGAKAGYDYWATSEHGEAQNFYAQFEHFVPLVPNVAAQITLFDDSELKLNSIDVYGYYEILDNGLVFLDLGAGFRVLDSGELRNYEKKNEWDKFNDTLPMVTGDVAIVPASRVSPFASVKLGTARKSNFTDAAAGIRLSTVPALKIEGGYRYYQLHLDGLDGIYDTEEIQGGFIGLHIDI